MPLLLLWAGAGILGAFGVGFAVKEVKESVNTIIPLTVVGATAYIVITHPEILNGIKKGLVK